MLPLDCNQTLSGAQEQEGRGTRITWKPLEKAVVRKEDNNANPTPTGVLLELELYESCTAAHLNLHLPLPGNMVSNPLPRTELSNKPTVPEQEGGSHFSGHELGLTIACSLLHLVSDTPDTPAS